MDFIFQLLSPLESTGGAAIFAGFANVATIILGTAFFAYCMELIVKRKKPRYQENSKFIKASFATTISVVVLLVLLYAYYVQNSDPIPFLDGLIMILNPVVGISNLSSVPVEAFAINLFFRYILVLILTFAVRTGLTFLKASRESFALFLDSLESRTKKAAEIPPEAIREIAGEAAEDVAAKGHKMSFLEWTIRAIKSLFSLKGLLAIFTSTTFLAFLFGGTDNPAQVITATYGMLSRILPLGMLEPPPNATASHLLNNFAIVLLIIFIAFIYLSIFIAFVAFLKHLRKELKNVEWKGNILKLILNIFAAVIVATLCVVGVFIFMYSYEDLVGNNSFFQNLSNHNFFIQLLLIVATILALFIGFGVLILALAALVGFLFFISSYAWHTGTKTMEDVRENAGAAKWGKSTLLSLIRDIIKGIFQFVADMVTSVLGVFIKATPKVRFIMAHTAVGLFALASSFNTLMGFRYFYVPLNEIGAIDEVPSWMYWIVSIAVSVGLQLAIVVFGLRAGEVYRANKHTRIKKIGQIFTRPYFTQRDTKNIYIAPYIFFLIISITFAYTNIFSRFANTAQIRNTLLSEVQARTDEVLDVRGRVNNVQTAYDDSRADFVRLLHADLGETERRHTIAHAHLSALEAQESTVLNAAGERAAWHASNDFDRFRINTQNFEDLADEIVRLIYSDDDVFYRRNIYVTRYSHFWENNVVPAYTSRSVRYYINGEPFIIGDTFSTPHPFRLDADDYERSAFAETVGWAGILPPNRMMGNSNRHSTVQTGITPILYGSKYQLIVEVLNLYITISNTVDSAYHRATNNSTPPASDRASMTNVTRINDNDQLWAAFSRLMVADGIRRNLASIYRSINLSYSGTQDTSDIIQMADLSRIVESILEHAFESGESDTPISRMDAVSNYVEMSIRIYHIVAVLDNGGINANGDAPESTGTLNTHSVRAFRDYAYSLSNSDFLLSYDILLRGFFVNPYRNELRSIYSSFILAIIFFAICIIKDYASFFVGRKNFYNKPIYNFKMKKGQLLWDIGYFKFEDQLSAFFDMPACNLGDNDSKETFLHRMFIYDILNEQGVVAGSHVKHNKRTKTEDLFHDWELIQSYVNYKQVRFEQLKQVFSIDMEDAESNALLRTWLGSHTKGL